MVLVGYLPISLFVMRCRSATLPRADGLRERVPFMRVFTDLVTSGQ